MDTTAQLQATLPSCAEQSDSTVALAPLMKGETADERTVIQTAANDLSQTIQTDNIHNFPFRSSQYH